MAFAALQIAGRASGVGTACRAQVLPSMLSEVERLRLVMDFERLQNVEQVATINGVSRDTVRRWVKCYEKTSGVATRPGAGRKPSLDGAGVDQATKMLLGGKYDGAKHVAMELHKQGVSTSLRPLHRTKISRLVKARGVELGNPVRVLRGQPKKQLSRAAKTKRLAFASKLKRACWRTTMFTDRKKFLFRYPGTSVKRYSWVQKGGRRQATRASRLVGINVYAGITKYGITKVHCVAGTHNLTTNHTNLKGQEAKNITKSEYKEVLEKTLLPEGTKIFRNQGITSWVFQQDNDPCHHRHHQCMEQENFRSEGHFAPRLAWKQP